MPAIPKGVWATTIKPLFIKKAKTAALPISHASGGHAIVPCIDPRLVNLIKKGLDDFSSLTAHKLIRWQIQTGFDNWINNKKDPRLVSTSGGYEGIAGLIGCGSSHKAITTVKAILHAQAYAQFSFYDGSQGNMVILREIERHKNGEPSKINIVLGELLLPNYTHFLPKGEKRRLIPVPVLPPMVGSNNTHAAQAMLQLLILEEFSNQSHTLVERGYVHLPREKWVELGLEARLPKSMIERVLLKWIEHDFLRKACIERMQDAFILGGAYFQLSEFLYDQGKLRIEGEKAGERSAASKRALKARKYSSNLRSPNSTLARSPNISLVRSPSSGDILF